MSATPRIPIPQNLDAPLPMTLPRLAEKKRLGEPIVMVTAYDYPSAQVAEEAGVDVVLVGDSGAMTVLGYPSTVPVSIDEMLMLAAAVRRGLQTPLLVGDLPFGSYEASDEQAIATAQRFIKEAGCDAVKLERGGIERPARPGDRRGRDPGHGPRRADAADRDRARRLPGAGPDGRARPRRRPRRARAAGRRAASRSCSRRSRPRSRRRVMARLEIPVIGIGAGPATDGQVLVFHDLLGIYDGHAPRFAKRYGELRGADGRRRRRVRRRGAQRRVPGPEHTYSIDDDELRAFEAGLDADRRADAPR